MSVLNIRTKMEENNEKIEKLYEMSFLLVNEEDMPAVSKVLAQFGATVVKEATLRRVALSYPIKKQVSAIFGFLYVRMLPSAAKEIENDLRNNATILRALILSIPEIKEKKSEGGEGEKKAYHAPSTHSAEKKPAAPAAISNEDLTKKIEEIMQ